MIVYADILLLVNFSMDILTLYAAGRLTGKRMTKGRIIASAAAGSIIATLMTLLLSHDSTVTGVLTIVTMLVVSAMMARISYGKYASLAALFKDSVIIWGAGALLGGIMTVILSFGETLTPVTNGSYVTVFSLCAFSALGVLRFLLTSRAKRTAEIAVTSGKETVVISALCDSGSFATDPMSGLPVIIVKSTAVRNVAKELYSPNCSLRLRMIPLSGVGGACMMRGFIPERVTVDNDEVSAVIAVDMSQGSFSGYEGLVPAVLCK